MSLQGELLVLATGLLDAPTRQHVRAARAIEGEIRAVIVAALDREEPAPFLAVPERKTYFDRLVRYEPNYDRNEALLGHELATEYQLVHQAARALLIKRRPVTEYQTIVGPRQLPNSPDQDYAFALEVETIENHVRLAKDLAAGAVLPEPTALFAGVFPAVYASIVDMAGKGLAKKVFVDEEWIPPPWLDTSLRILTRVSFDAVVDMTEPAPSNLPPAQTSARGKLKLKPAGLQTPAQSVLSLPEPRR